MLVVLASVLMPAVAMAQSAFSADFRIPTQAVESAGSPVSAQSNALSTGPLKTVVTVGRIADNEKAAGTARLREGYIPTLDMGVPLSVTTAALPIAVVNAPFSFAFQSAEGVAPFFWCVMSGMLPEGLSLNVVTGELSGTPPRAGEFSFMVQVTDSAAPPHTAARRFTLVVLASNGLLANPGLNSPYNVSDHGFVADGWTEFAWPGFNAPDFAGESAVKVEGDGSQKVGKFDVWRGGVRQAVAVTPGVRFTARARAIVVSDEVGDNNVRIGIGVADGVTADPTQIAVSDLRWDQEADLRTWSAFEASFTPTQSTVTVFLIGYNVNAFDTAVYFDDAGPVIPPLPLEITTATLPDGTTAQGYSQAVAATGGAPPYAWAIVSGVLPDGLALDGGSGIVAGTPTTPGVAAFTLRATDAAMPARAATRDLTIAVHAAGGDPPGGLLAIATSALPNGVINQTYAFTLAGAGGTAPLTWSWAADSGPFPNGLALDPDTGAIAGTPTATGVARVTVTVTDASAPAQRATRGFTLEFDAVPPLTITTASPLPDAGAGVPYSQTLQAVNGQPAYGWCVSAGALPLGLSLNAASGQISGVAFVEGVFSFTVKVTDSAAPAHTASKAFTIQVFSDPAPPLHIRLVKLSGDGQTGLTNRCPHDPLVWRTESAGTGEPLAGIATQVDFTAGDGIIVEAPNLSTVTDDQGRAGVRVIAGPKAETLNVRVSVLGATDIEPIVFNLASFLPRLEMVSDDPGPGNFTAIDPMRAVCGLGRGGPQATQRMDRVYPGWAVGAILGPRVKDEKGSRVAGVEVRPVLIAPDGSEQPMEGVIEFMPSKALTNADGQAFFATLIPSASPPQRLRVRFELPEFDSGDVNHTPIGCDWAVDVLDPTLTPLDLSLASGQGQIALAGNEVHNPLVAVTSRVDSETHLGSVSFLTREPGDVLTPVEGNVVVNVQNPDGTMFLQLEGAGGRCAVKLTLGPEPLPRLVWPGIIDEPTHFIAVGGPEVRVVEETIPGSMQYQLVTRIRGGLFFDPITGAQLQYDPSNQFFVELLVPVTFSSIATATLHTLDACGLEVSSVPLAAAPINVSTVLTRNNENSRFATYLSSALLAIPSRTPTTPGITFTPTVAGPGGETVIQLVAGSGADVLIPAAFARALARDAEVLPSAVVITAEGGVVLPGGVPPALVPTATRRITPRIQVTPAQPALSVNPVDVGGFPPSAGLTLTVNAATGFIDIGFAPRNPAIPDVSSAPEGFVVRAAINRFNAARGINEALGTPYLVVPPQILVQLLLGEAQGELAREVARAAVPAARDLTGAMTYGTVTNGAGQVLSPTALALAWTVRTRRSDPNPGRVFGNNTYTGIIQAVHNGVYQYVPVDPVNENYHVFRNASRISSAENVPAYLLSMESAANVYAGLSTDPTGGCHSFVTPKTSIPDIQSAIREGRTGPVNQGTDAHFTLTFGRVEDGHDPLQVVIINNVPRFVFFRAFPQNNPGAPTYVILPDVTGN